MSTFLSILQREEKRKTPFWTRKRKKIKNLNNKMAINIYLSIIESKKNEQTKQKQTYRYREHFDGC